MEGLLEAYTADNVEHFLANDDYFQQTILMCVASCLCVSHTVFCRITVYNLLLHLCVCVTASSIPWGYEVVISKYVWMQ